MKLFIFSTTKECGICNRRILIAITKTGTFFTEATVVLPEELPPTIKIR